MRLSRIVRDKLVSHALQDAPNECCGMVASADGELCWSYACANMAASMTRYEIDGLDQMAILEEIAERFWELGAIYHSHTIAPAEPSEMDVASAFYPDVLYLIVGVQDPDWPEVRGFWIRDGQVEEEPLEIS